MSTSRICIASCKASLLQQSDLLRLLFLSLFLRFLLFPLVLLLTCCSSMCLSSLLKSLKLLPKFHSWVWLWSWLMISNDTFAYIRVSCVLMWFQYVLPQSRGESEQVQPVVQESDRQSQMVQVQVPGAPGARWAVQVLSLALLVSFLKLLGGLEAALQFELPSREHPKHFSLADSQMHPHWVHSDAPYPLARLEAVGHPQPGLVELEQLCC